MGALPTLTYCVARGNRARLWHRVNIEAVRDARKALRDAQKAKVVAEDEDAALKRVLDRADRFLSGNDGLTGSDAISIIRFGRLQIMIRPK